MERVMRRLNWKSGELSARALPVIAGGALWGYLAVAVLYGAMLA